VSTRRNPFVVEDYDYRLSRARDPGLRPPSVAQTSSQSSSKTLACAADPSSQTARSNAGAIDEPRADDEVENAGTHLVADMPHLLKHRIRAADDHLAERDAISELTARRALPLRHWKHCISCRRYTSDCSTLVSGPSGVEELKPVYPADRSH
jgi:hypothetical protein